MTGGWGENPKEDDRKAAFGGKTGRKRKNRQRKNKTLQKSNDNIKNNGNNRENIEKQGKNWNIKCKGVKGVFAIYITIRYTGAENT